MGDYSLDKTVAALDGKYRYAMGGKASNNGQPGVVSRIIAKFDMQTGQVSELFNEQIGNHYVENFVLASHGKTFFYVRKDRQSDEAELFAFDLMTSNSTPTRLMTSVHLLGKY